METLDYWKFAAGLGLFLFGMLRLEEALKELTGKRFKLFLKKYTTNRFLAILNGAFATAILQSSSIVLLMVIAFAGAGIITLSNSLGIILGANVGTTITGWLVSAFGFKINVEAFILPLVGIGSLGLIFVSHRLPFYHIFGFIIGAGLLFMGLDFMKQSMGQLAHTIDIKELEKLGLGIYFLFGLFVTALIHSSSAMMTITLSALHANIIGLMPAALMVIGADLGTTMTALVASLHGTPVKKRIGLAHFTFNLVTGVLAIMMVKPALNLIRENFNMTDPLYTLVAFHTGFNLFGLFLFVPFLGVFEKFLERFFKNKNDKVCLFIHQVGTEVPEVALESVRLELNHFLKNVFHFNLGLIGFKDEENNKNKSFRFLNFILPDEDVSKDYEKIKKVESEILEYFISIQKEKLDDAEVKLLNQYTATLRKGVQSAKSVKDVKHNLQEFRQSVVEIVETAMVKIYKAYWPLESRIKLVWQLQDKKTITEELAAIHTDNDTAYQTINDWIYRHAPTLQNADQQIASFLNVNREMYNANQLLVEALSSCQ